MQFIYAVLAIIAFLAGLYFLVAGIGAMAQIAGLILIVAAAAFMIAAEVAEISSLLRRQFPKAEDPKQGM